MSRQIWQQSTLTTTPQPWKSHTTPSLDRISAHDSEVASEIHAEIPDTQTKGFETNMIKDTHAAAACVSAQNVTAPLTASERRQSRKERGMWKKSEDIKNKRWIKIDRSTDWTHWWSWSVEMWRSCREYHKRSVRTPDRCSRQSLEDGDSSVWALLSHPVNKQIIKQLFV